MQFDRNCSDTGFENRASKFRVAFKGSQTLLSAESLKKGTFPIGTVKYLRLGQQDLLPGKSLFDEPVLLARELRKEE